MWVLSDLDFYKTKNGFLFGYKKVGETLFIALEPLHESDADLSLAIEELKIFTQTKTIAVIGIYQKMMSQLLSMGFSGLKFGRDPWISLESCEPKGNKGKGIRSARNQALKDGVTVCEWNLKETNQDLAKKNKLEHVLNGWKAQSVLQLEGFLLTIDPFKELPGRKLFVAEKNNTVVAFLLATPVENKVSYYFEDLIYTPSAPNGTTELLTLTAFQTLKDLGFKEVSLGVVAINNLSLIDNQNRFYDFCMDAAKFIASFFYNSSGIELYRKRYQPVRWDDVFVALRSEASPVTLTTWMRMMASAFFLFRPKIKLSTAQISTFFSRQIHRNYVIFSFGFATFTMYLLHSHPVEFLICLILGCYLITKLQKNVRRFELSLFVLLIFGMDSLLLGPGNLKSALEFQDAFPVVLSWLAPAVLTISIFGFWIQQLRTQKVKSFLLSLILIAANCGGIFWQTQSVFLTLSPVLFFGLGVSGGKLFSIYERQLSHYYAKGSSPHISKDSSDHKQGVA